jgi:hypothetical protein
MSHSSELWGRLIGDFYRGKYYPVGCSVMWDKMAGGDTAGTPLLRHVDALAFLSASEKHAILEGNARRVLGLGASDTERP